MQMSMQRPDWSVHMCGMVNVSTIGYYKAWCALGCVSTGRGRRQPDV